MIHRAPFGSMDRMVGLLTEHYAGAFPLWLAPVQVAVLPISDRHVGYAEALARALQGFPTPGLNIAEYEGAAEPESFGIAPIGARYRVEIDRRRETLGKKIRENQKMKVPFMLIVGDRDMEAGTVGVRSREDGDLGAMPLAKFVEAIKAEVAERKAELSVKP